MKTKKTSNILLDDLKTDPRVLDLLEIICDSTRIMNAILDDYNISLDAIINSYNDLQMNKKNQTKSEKLMIETESLMSLHEQICPHH